MKSSKILSLLFSLAQLIFFIKLIEHCVAGAESKSVNLNTTNSSSADKIVVHIQQDGTSTQKTVVESRSDNINSNSSHSSIKNDRLGHDRSLDVLGLNGKKKTASKSTSDANVAHGTARDCPACVGDCNSNIHQFAFPFWQLKVGVFTIIVWYLVFLFVWKYPKKPEHQTGGYGGYSAPVSSGGYSNPVPMYGAPVQGGYSSSSDNSGSGGFDGVLDSVYQAFSSFEKKYSNQG